MRLATKNPKYRNRQVSQSWRVNVDHIKGLDHISQATECVNVTDLESSKRHSIFVACMNREGFAGFIKHKQNNQTYIIFIYKET